MPSQPLDAPSQPLDTPSQPLDAASQPLDMPSKPLDAPSSPPIMPHVCKECGLELGNKNAHWKKCVSIVTFVAYTGQDVTITCHENGTFLCYCSHHKCPRDIGFTTADALHKHMKTLKTTWLGLEKKASAGEQSSVQAVNATAVPMEITTNTPPPQMPAAIPQNKTMMTPLAASNGDAPMHSPPTAFDMSGQVEGSAMALPHAPSPRSLQVMEGPSLMSSTAEEEHYKMLPESIQLYFEEALALIDTTDELVLQQLNSPDPAKEGISNTPFHKHMHDSSMKKYVHPIICFFTMLLHDLWYLPDANMEITRLDHMLQV
ncbi:hypothetical protein EDD16DRAFT_1707158 [Pisolithus croceorrhizus]|nr:hypothetical protein EDD16DRAFT_1707158 [Pisolithus croceorrhizus]KAI6137486.1 hypothetical protein EDD17DRAFT_1771524 [Pisolithus thermaeus]